MNPTQADFVSKGRVRRDGPLQLEDGTTSIDIPDAPKHDKVSKRQSR